MGQLSIFAFCFQGRGLVFLKKTMMNDESNALPCPKGAFSDVLEGVVLKIFSGCKHPDPRALKQVETYVQDKCFSIDHLHLKGIKFITIEKRSKQLWFISFEFTCLTRQLEACHPPRICSSAAPESSTGCS